MQTEAEARRFARRGRQSSAREQNEFFILMPPNVLDFNVYKCFTLAARGCLIMMSMFQARHACMAQKIIRKRVEDINVPRLMICKVSQKICDSWTMFN